MTVSFSVAAHVSVAADFESDEELYVVSASAAVRVEPNTKSAVTGTLPIGTKMQVAGPDMEVLCGHPSETAGTRKWLCIYTTDFAGGEESYWGGWVASDQLGRTAPSMAALIRELDAIPKSNHIERKKVAERAVALDPLDPRAQQRLLDILAALGDQVALADARRKFDVYSYPPAASTGKDEKQVFILQGERLQPFAKVTSDGLTYSGRSNPRFLQPGQFYSAYSAGKKVGSVVTKIQFDCSVKECPSTTFVRHLPLKEHGRSGRLALNYVLAPRNPATSAITPQQKAILEAMARAWIASRGPASEPQRAFLRGLRDGSLQSELAVGQLSGGRLALIGSWVMGSMGDARYSDTFHEALLIVAEQRQDGTFQPAPGSGSVAEQGCAYFDHADLDDNGTDEIVMRCDQLEGQYGYQVFRRAGNKWGFAKH